MDAPAEPVDEVVEADAPAVPRRFTLADAMVLVAATAVGFALAGTISDWFAGLGQSVPTTFRTFAAWFALTVPVAAAWTSAVVVLRGFSPKGSAGRSTRSIGHLAAGAATLAMAFGAPALAIPWLLSYGSTDTDTHEIVLMISPMVLAGAILGARLSLRLAGRRERPIDWVDRLGRLLGWYWVIVAPVAFWALLEFA